MTDKVVVFSTPGLIPIEAFTIFGMNAKPNSVSPFGFFGTGLKIAIAVCMRHGLDVTIWRGTDRYAFYPQKTNFRGKEFSKIRMRCETWHLGNILRKRYTDLPFTTELGKHWELWQAFREFQTNTIDEGGFTMVGHLADDSVQGDSDRSLVIVGGQKFLDEYYDRHRNFLEDGLTERGDSTGDIQVLDKPSNHVYYRGVRVMDLKEPSKYTYNFLRAVDLTEDRTAKYPWMLESWICEHIMQSKDEDFVRQTAGAQAGFEARLGYNYVSVTPSATFVSVAHTSPNPNAKQIAVQASAPIVPTTRITITVPKSEVTQDELDTLTKAVEDLFGTCQVEKLGDH